MAFPAGWPPRPATGVRSIRFFATGNTSNNFSDAAFLFGDTSPKSQVDPVPVATPRDSAAFGSDQRPSSPAGFSNTSAKGTSTPQTKVVPYRHASNIWIFNDGVKDLTFTFDEATDIGAGAGIHGVVKAGKDMLFRDRYEAGIALKSAVDNNATAYRVFAW